MNQVQKWRISEVLLKRDLLVQTLACFDLQLQNACSAILTCTPAEDPWDRIVEKTTKATRSGGSWRDSIVRG